MYFCNMLDENGVKTFRNKEDIIPFEVTSSEDVSEGFLTLKEGKVVFTNDKSDVNIFGNGFDGEPSEKFASRFKSGLLNKTVQDTTENPMIIVLCNTIRVYAGVPANIKYINLGKEGILACLVYGACEFDGVPMQRCNTSDLSGRQTIKYTGAELEQISEKLFEDAESGYAYHNDIVAHVEIKHNAKEINSRQIGIYRDGVFFLTKQKLAQQQKRAREIKEKREQMRQQALAERAERERLAKEKMATKAKQKKEKAKETFTEVNMGASAFLSLVKSLGGEN